MSIELAKKIGASFQDNFVYFDFQQLEAYDKALTKDESFVIYVDAGERRLLERRVVRLFQRRVK